MTIKEAGSHFWNFVDSRLIVRRLVLFFTLYITWYGVHEAWKFAAISKLDGIGTAAVIAAILAPIAALQGFAFRDYTSARSE